MEVVARHWIEAAIQREVRVRRVQARMVEEVERVHFILQVEALIDLEILEDREIETRLERCAEDVAARGAEPGFEVVANIEAALIIWQGGTPSFPGAIEGARRSSDSRMAGCVNATLSSSAARLRLASLGVIPGARGRIGLVTKSSAL